MSVKDMIAPGTTDPEAIKNRIRKYRSQDGICVVFTTYHSLPVLSDALKKLEKHNPEAGTVDLLICDEAHRTTGIKSDMKEDSHFVVAHDDEVIRANRRLYMTATPRIYKDLNEKSDIVLCSMDDETIYGKEIYRLDFGTAVELDLLCDYKVLIMTTVSHVDLGDDVVEEVEYNAKLVGTIKALEKKMYNPEMLGGDVAPMQRAVIFCATIKESKDVRDDLNNISQTMLAESPDGMQIEVEHVDGSMGATLRSSHIDRLYRGKRDSCFALSNVRCLGEGVDVPNLDAAVFLSAKYSTIDVVQAVGRVMRKSPGKKYGYIVLPVFVDKDLSPSAALEQSKKFERVWQVLKALREHDTRIEAEINADSTLNRIVVTTDNVEAFTHPATENVESMPELSENLQNTFNDYKQQLLAKIVKRVGKKKYWEEWAGDVAQLAVERCKDLRNLIDNNVRARSAFTAYLESLRQSINATLKEEDAVDFLAQHTITKPVFDALFEGYAFSKENAVSQALDQVIDIIDGEMTFLKSDKLNAFFKSIRDRAKAIEGKEQRQKVVNELYEKFFRTAFPKTAEQLGIVYTPIEVVDFINQGVDTLLQKHFGKRLKDKDVNILAPFTGTGTFIVRLIEKDLLGKGETLHDKYKNEVFANEIMLLPYYISTVNIENAYHECQDQDDAFLSFEGICWCDTFSQFERNSNPSLEGFNLNNNARLLNQKKRKISVIVGNPPYSVGQKRANDNAKNVYYPDLEERIKDTYAKYSASQNKNSLRDSYFKAFRWASDRIKYKGISKGGIVAFVTNGGWLRGSSGDGFRKALAEEFDAVYVVDLRGELRRGKKQGESVFEVKVSATIVFLIKESHLKFIRDGEKKWIKKSKKKPGIIYYLDIGEYLKREEKWQKLKNWSEDFEGLPWQKITPNTHGDWIEQRDENFENFLPLAPEKKFSEKAEAFFSVYSRGVCSGRDAWVYNFNLEKLQNNIQKTIAHYNDTLKKIQNGIFAEPQRNSRLGSWNREWLKYLVQKKIIEEVDNAYCESLYRPFCKQHYYRDQKLNDQIYQMPKFFPNAELSNLCIVISGLGHGNGFSALMAGHIPCLDFIEKGQAFPLYWYENRVDRVFGDQGTIKRDGISPWILKKARGLYGDDVCNEDIFYFVYAALHDRTYREAYADTLTKVLPRLELPDNDRFRKLSQIGRQLADLHVNYESVAPCPQVEVVGRPSRAFRVQKMAFGKNKDRTTIIITIYRSNIITIYRSNIVVRNIPERAYDYVVNGKSAIEWIMDRYQIKEDKKTGIVNDPNDWAGGDYIVDLLLRIIEVSLRTLDLMDEIEA